jgi:DNA repair exonuclease SbcCD ATPase subunit
MIQRLELRRWRAFDHVAIDFEPGTTFLVAPNAVGKTSLLLGLTWAVFGDDPNVDAKTCVRLGHDNAEAVVTIAVGENRQLVIARTVTAAGKTTVEYRDANRQIDEATAQQLLADEFGAPVEIAARLAVIRGAGRDQGELQLREHLYDAFGVSGLRQAATWATKLHKEAVAARKKLRTASRAQLANRDQLATRASKLRVEIKELSARRAPLAEAFTEAVQAQQTAAEWAVHDAEVVAQTSAIDEFLADIADRGIAAANLSEVAEALLTAITAVRGATDQAQMILDDARAQMFAARTALDLLKAHDPSCPTCARPFRGDELDRAIAAQTESLTLAQARIHAAIIELQRLADEEAQMNDLRSTVDELSESPVEPDTPRPTGDPDAAVVAAQEALRRHDEFAGRMTNERDAIVAQRDNNDELQAAYAAERVAWRREALLQAAASALVGTAERVAQEYIEPLSQQVRWRWKALFGEDGLQLRPDGTIVRVIGDRELPWSQLSGGEQIWARLVASLLVLRSSTTLSFAWLDEPLEHLDPRARRIVATDLASATQSGRPAQLIVTTYEHTLARQLAEDVPDTQVRQINRSEMGDPPPRRGRATRPTSSTRRNGQSSDTAYRETA